MNKCQKKILVVGDVMVDQYWKGSSVRLSPEAPVPVVNVSQVETRLGGAANVALNLAHLGVNVALCGIVGADQEANLLRKKLVEAGIEDRLVVGNPNYRTIQKVRVISQNQQIVRADFESLPDEETIERISQVAIEQLSTVESVILSDYKKGALFQAGRLIDAAKKDGIRVLVDPKGNDYSSYRGATVITPNKAELAAVMGAWKSEKELIDKAQALRNAINAEKILLTRSEEGMTLFDSTGYTTFPAEAREVYDVSGAGDTAIATLAMMLTAGADWFEAVRVANYAAGVVVGRFGTSAITREDLRL